MPIQGMAHGVNVQVGSARMLGQEIVSVTLDHQKLQHGLRGILIHEAIMKPYSRCSSFRRSCFNYLRNLYSRDWHSKLALVNLWS